MKLVVFGASGGTGREIIGQALEQGHDVTAFVRDPKKLQIKDSRLKVIEGDALKDQATITEVIAGRDAIICALGVANSLKSNGLIARSLAFQKYPTPMSLILRWHNSQTRLSCA